MAEIEHEDNCLADRIYSEGRDWQVLPIELAEMIAAHRQAAEDRVARRAFAVLEEYIAAYPVDIFPQPPYGQHGKTVDACSAAALRAVLPNVLRDLRLALAGPEGGEGGDDAKR